MILVQVIYTNSDGMREIRYVPEGTPPTQWGMGVFAGPPDLSELPLKEEQKVELNNKLVDAGLIDYTSLSGRRFELLRIIQAIPGINQPAATELRYEILRIYQQDHHSDNFEVKE